MLERDPILIEREKLSLIIVEMGTSLSAAPWGAFHLINRYELAIITFLSIKINECKCRVNERYEG